MRRLPFQRPTTHYDERIKQIDETICELIRKRKQVSDNNPGYPPFSYIAEWSEKFDLYDELLKSIFGSLWNDKVYKPMAEPENFIKNLPVLRSTEIDCRLFSIVSIRQYKNASVINFNVDWNYEMDMSEHHVRHTHFELSIDERYDCRIAEGTGGGGHLHYNYIVAPPLPDDVSGLELVFEESDFEGGHKSILQNIKITL